MLIECGFCGTTLRRRAPSRVAKKSESDSQIAHNGQVLGNIERYVVPGLALEIGIVVDDDSFGHDGWPVFTGLPVQVFNNQITQYGNIFTAFDAFLGING